MRYFSLVELLLILMLLLPFLLIILLVMAVVRISVGKVRAGVRLLLVALGVLLVVLVWADWQGDWSGLRLRSQIILGFHIYQHRYSLQATALWDRVQRVVRQSRDTKDPQGQKEAYWTLLSATFAVEEGWILQGLGEELEPRMTVDVIVLKEDPALAGGKKVLSMLKEDHQDRPHGIMEWLTTATRYVDSWQAMTNSEIVVLNYTFRIPQANDGIADEIAKLQVEFGDTANPIVISWLDEGGNPTTVCMGCDGSLTLQDAKNQICQQRGICANIAQTPERFLRNFPPSQ